MTLTTAATFSIEPLGPFSLAAAARFWGGFTPAAHAGADADGHLHMAFADEEQWKPTGICLREMDGMLDDCPWCGAVLDNAPTIM